ncbi:MAG: hypothetical protein E6X23_07260 [Mixta calida]|nr:hypothetical protein [Mixta calida]MDU3818836.1 hypothetical protein [Pantoea sp.]KAF0859941.1 hypothetical protein Y888_08715 [Mixta calida B021323]MDU4941318.1 hypothetical protein [Mixta calida]MDU5193149.1 hypothetical protein [Mixta calida]MDU6416549.1 hypothetical protein [Mixta calida]
MMKKNNLLSEIDKTTAYIENVMNNEKKGGLKDLIADLDRLKLKVVDDDLFNNPLRGFPRKYAEMYNDYLHPITNVLDKMEKSVDSYLEAN